jgi:ATP phosphoribosyltransferase regulatory subunit
MVNNVSNEKNSWLLPEGIDEFLPPQAERLERLRRSLLDLYSSWGYEYVIPPMVEYLESLLVGTGTELELETFKLIDQKSGRLLGVHADMTPQVARIDAHRLNREGPTRLCYLDAVLHTRQDGFSRGRCPLQIGAELYGHAGIESDAEVIHLMVETLRLAGLDEIHIDLGHVGIFRTLAQYAGLTAEQEALLFDALQRKAKPEIEELLADVCNDADARTMLLALVDLNGGAEVLDEARSVLKSAGDEVIAAIDKLQQIADFACQRMGDISLHFDLAELRGYRYQTGVVFAAFVPGHGQEVARGGRYDDIGSVFGRSRPATGFSSDLKTLMLLRDAAISRPSAIIAYPCANSEQRAGLQAFIGNLRDEGERVIEFLPGQQDDVSETGCDRKIVEISGQWQVVDLE